tara:strand:- start:796 stop:1212 length:417 start_codon:yes stop_codon:yes gene_type:complete
MSYVKQSEKLEELFSEIDIEPFFYDGGYYDISHLGDYEETILILHCETWTDEAHYNSLVRDAHSDFDDMMDDIYEPYKIGYLTLYASEAMKTDEVFYRTAFNEEIDMRGEDILDECTRYDIDDIEELFGEEIAREVED